MNPSDSSESAAVARFSGDKARVLGQVDLSRKGSVDEAIHHLVSFINSQENYYTTSSCSGRISVFCEESGGRGEAQRKKGCQWLLTSHEPIQLSQLVAALESVPVTTGYVFFKFEPFILHTMCRALHDAQTMLQAAVACGFRNSGLTCGKKGRIMIAVRSTHSLEAPVGHNGELIVSEQYLNVLVSISNEKLAGNLQRVERFYHELKTVLTERDPPSAAQSRKQTVGHVSHPIVMDSDECLTALSTDNSVVDIPNMEETGLTCLFGDKEL